MRYRINKYQRQLDILFNLKGKEINLLLDIAETENQVMRYDKYRKPWEGTQIELKGAQRTEFYIEDLKHLVDYLNNVPTIDEKYLGYALYDISIFQIIKNGRLFDGDLAGFANTLMEVYETYLDGNLTLSDGIEIRTRIIQEILRSELKEHIIISNFTSLDTPPIMTKYVECESELRYLLGI